MRTSNPKHSFVSSLMMLCMCVILAGAISAACLEYLAVGHQKPSIVPFVRYVHVSTSSNEFDMNILPNKPNLPCNSSCFLTLGRSFITLYLTGIGIMSVRLSGIMKNESISYGFDPLEKRFHTFWSEPRFSIILTHLIPLTCSDGSCSVP
jgi:hypothetical protein